MKRTTLLATGLLHAATATAAQVTNDALPRDPLAPIAAARGALTGPLSGAIIVTRDLEGVERAYVQGLKLTMSTALVLTDVDRKAAAQLWGIPNSLGWQAYRLTRASLPDAIKVIVIVPDSDTPVVRLSYERTESGPYALGFPLLDVHAVDRQMLRLGFKRTLPAVNEYKLELRDGTPYGIHEASYETADNTRLVALSRRDGLPQVGSVEPSGGLGGPAYSSQVVDDITSMARFFTDILDYEVRTRRDWLTFDPKFVYLTLHARGSRTGNLGLVEYEPQFRSRSSGIAPRPPNRGLVGWMFPVKSLDAILKRANSAGTSPVAGPISYRHPLFGKVRAITFHAPNGFLIEVFEHRRR